MKLLSEQIQEWDGKYYHLIQYADRAISSSPITSEEAAELNAMWGSDHWDY